MTLTRFFTRQVDYFLVMSEKVREDLLSVKKNARYKLVQHPLYTNFGKPIARHKARRLLGIKEENVILYFGFIRKYKGVQYLIRAVPEIVSRKDVRTLIVGEFYDEPEPYLREIEKTEVKDKITLVPDFVPDEKVRLYFCAADLIVLPYISATQSGIVKIALYYEKPCLVTSTGGLPEIVEDGRTGYVVPPQNPAAIAAKVLQFFDSNDRERLIKNLRREKERYSWKNLVKAIEELVEVSIAR